MCVLCVCFCFLCICCVLLLCGSGVFLVRSLCVSGAVLVCFWCGSGVVLVRSLCVFCWCVRTRHHNYQSTFSIAHKRDPHDMFSNHLSYTLEEIDRNTSTYGINVFDRHTVLYTILELLDPDLVTSGSRNSIGSLLHSGECSSYINQKLIHAMKKDQNSLEDLMSIRLYPSGFVMSHEFIDTKMADEMESNKRQRCVAIKGCDGLLVMDNDVNSEADGEKQEEEKCMGLITMKLNEGSGNECKHTELHLKRVSENEVTLFCVEVSMNHPIKEYNFGLIVAHRLIEAKYMHLMPKLFTNKKCISEHESIIRELLQVQTYSLLAIGDYLQRNVRLHTLCCSATDVLARRNVVIDKAILGDSEDPRAITAACNLNVYVTLHPSSSQCICVGRSKGRRPEGDAKVTISMATCGRQCTPTCLFHPSVNSLAQKSSFNGHCSSKTGFKIECSHFRHGIDKKRHIGTTIDGVFKNKFEEQEMRAILSAIAEARDTTLQFITAGALHAGEFTRKMKKIQYISRVTLENIANEKEEQCRQPEEEELQVLDTNASQLLRSGLLANNNNKEYHKKHKSTNKGVVFSVASTHGHLFADKRP